jgi:hypothetical protein
MRTEGLDYREALEFLAARAGIDIPEDRDPTENERTVPRARIYEMNRDAAKFFRDCLFNSNIGSEAMDKAVQEVFDICKKYNKSCGIFCDNEILAKKYRDMGANVLWMAVDRDYYMRGLNAMLDGVKEL